MNAPELMQYRRTGDPALAKELYQAWAPRMYAVAVGVTRDPTQAEDAVQRALWRMFDRTRPVPALTSLGPWLATVVLNEARMQLRTESRRSTREERAHNDRVQRAAQTPLENAMAEESSDALRRAVEELSDELRLPTVLYYWNEMSQAEVSTALEVPRATIGRRLEQARQHLASTLRLAPAILGTALPAAGATLEDAFREDLAERGWKELAGQLAAQALGAARVTTSPTRQRKRPGLRAGIASGAAIVLLALLLPRFGEPGPPAASQRASDRVAVGLTAGSVASGSASRPVPLPQAAAPAPDPIAMREVESANPFATSGRSILDALDEEAGGEDAGSGKIERWYAWIEATVIDPESGRVAEEFAGDFHAKPQHSLTADAPSFGLHLRWKRLRPGVFRTSVRSNGPVLWKLSATTRDEAGDVRYGAMVKAYTKPGQTLEVELPQTEPSPTAIWQPKALTAEDMTEAVAADPRIGTLRVSSTEASSLPLVAWIRSADDPADSRDLREIDQVEGARPREATFIAPVGRWELTLLCRRGTYHAAIQVEPRGELALELSAAMLRPFEPVTVRVMDEHGSPVPALVTILAEGASVRTNVVLALRHRAITLVGVATLEVPAGLDVSVYVMPVDSRFPTRRASVTGSDPIEFRLSVVEEPEKNSEE